MPFEIVNELQQSCEEVVGGDALELSGDGHVEELHPCGGQLLASGCEQTTARRS